MNGRNHLRSLKVAGSAVAAKTITSKEESNAIDARKKKMIRMPMADQNTWTSHSKPRKLSELTEGLLAKRKRKTERRKRKENQGTSAMDNSDRATGPASDAKTSTTPSEIHATSAS